MKKKRKSSGIIIIGNEVLSPSGMNITADFKDNLVSAIDESTVENIVPVDTATMVKSADDNFGVFR